MNSNAHPPYLAWPERARMQRSLPKSKFYEYGEVNAKTRELFVRQIEHISLDYALTPAATNLRARDGVPELHILRIELKTREFDFDLLRCIDAVWRFHTLLELVHDDAICIAGAYKHPSSHADAPWVCSGHYASAWFARETLRLPMPLALDLASLYTQILHGLLPLRARPAESLAELISRTELAAAKQREVAKTEARLGKEKQFNRKVEINVRLRQLKSELERLIT